MDGCVGILVVSCLDGQCQAAVLVSQVLSWHTSLAVAADTADLLAKHSRGKYGIALRLSQPE